MRKQHFMAFFNRRHETQLKRLNEGNRRCPSKCQCGLSCFFMDASIEIVIAPRTIRILSLLSPDQSLTESNWYAVVDQVVSASNILQATNFFTLQAIDYSFLLSAIHFPAHLATCTIRWLTHIIPELRRCLPDSLTIFQLPKS